MTIPFVLCINSACLLYRDNRIETHFALLHNNYIDFFYEPNYINDFIGFILAFLLTAVFLMHIIARKNFPCPPNTQNCMTIALGGRSLADIFAC